MSSSKDKVGTPTGKKRGRPRKNKSDAADVVNSIQQKNDSVVTSDKRKAIEAESQEQLELDLLRITDTSLARYPSRASNVSKTKETVINEAVTKVSDPYCAGCDDGGKEPLIICETCTLVHHESCLKRDFEGYTPIEEDPWYCPICKIRIEGGDEKLYNFLADKYSHHLFDNDSALFWVLYKFQVTPVRRNIISFTVPLQNRSPENYKQPLKYLGLTIESDSNDNKFTVTDRFKHDLFVKVFASKLAQAVCSSPKSPKKQKTKKISDAKKPITEVIKEARSTPVGDTGNHHELPEGDKLAQTDSAAQEMQRVMGDVTTQRAIVDWLSAETTKYDVKCVHDKAFQGFTVIAETIPELPQFFLLLNKVKEVIDGFNTEQVDKADKKPLVNIDEVRTTLGEISDKSAAVSKNAGELLQEEHEYLNKLKKEKNDLSKQINKQAMDSAGVVITAQKKVVVLEQQVQALKDELDKKYKELRDAERTVKDIQAAENAKIDELKALENNEMEDSQHVIMLAELVLEMANKETTAQLEKYCERYLTHDRINLEAQRTFLKEMLASIDNQIVQNKEMSPLLSKTREFHQQQLQECERKLRS